MNECTVCKELNFITLLHPKLSVPRLRTGSKCISLKKGFYEYRLANLVGIKDSSIIDHNFCTYFTLDERFARRATSFILQ